MENTNFKTGWSTKAWIEVKATSIYGFINDWKCDKSGQKLDDECLLVLRQNFKHRGNETDELYKYNRSSSHSKYLRVFIVTGKQIGRAHV